MNQPHNCIRISTTPSSLCVHLLQCPLQFLEYSAINLIQESRKQCTRHVSNIINQSILLVKVPSSPHFVLHCSFSCLVLIGSEKVTSLLIDWLLRHCFHSNQFIYNQLYSSIHFHIHFIYIFYLFRRKNQVRNG